MIRRMLTAAVCGILLFAICSPSATSAAEAICRAPVEVTAPDLTNAYSRFVREVNKVQTIPVAKLRTGSQHPDPDFGYYGYRHEELHKMGVIDKLIEQSNKSCCDGGKGGECRVTDLRYGGPTGREAYLDGQWCQITPGVKIFTNIELPDGAFAVVCAAKSNGSCPSNYCAAEVPGI